MRIQRLDLIAFGPFTDHTLNFDSKGPGLTVIFGPNEAGKSSCLRALKSLLYGIPERTPDNFLHSNDQLLLGGSLMADDGEHLTFLRRKRRITSLFDVHGNPLGSEALMPFIRGIELDEFETLYGIDHESLVQGGRDILAQKGEVGQALFSAGAGISSLREVLNALDTQADELFRPRASTRQINQALSDYKKLQKDVREATLSGADWTELEKELQKVEAELALVEQRRREKDRERRQLERLKQALPQLALRRQYLNRLQNLGTLNPLPDNFSQRRRKATDGLQGARQALNAATTRLSSLEEKKESVSFQVSLVDEGERIEALYQKLGSHQKAMKDRPRLEGMRIACRREAAALLRQIPTNLPLEQVERLRPFLGKRKAIQTLSSKFEALKQDLQQRQQQRRRLELALSEIDGALNQMPLPPHTEDLVQAVKLTRKSGDLDQQLLEKARLFETRQTQLLEDLAHLGLWNGDLKKATRLPLPLKETILRFEAEFRDWEEKRRTAEKTRNKLLEARERITGGIREIEYTGEVPTETDLTQVRNKRDHQWQLLKRHWLEGEDITLESRSFTEKDDLPEIYEKHCQMADSLSDRLRREADRVHKFAALKADQIANLEALKTLGEAMEATRSEMETLSTTWLLLWQPCGIEPLPPREMLDWSQRFEKIRSGAIELNHLEREISAQKAQRETLRKRLLITAKSLENTGAFQDESLEPALIFCETLLENLDLKKQNRRKLLDKQNDLTGDLQAARQHEEGAIEAMAEWEKRWSDAAALFIKGEGNSGETLSIFQPEEASDILEDLQSCFFKLKEADELFKRIEGIDRDAENFEREVQDLVALVTPDLKGLEPEPAVLQLQKRLMQNLEQKTLLLKYTREIEETREEIHRAEAAIHSAEAEMSDLRQIAGCKDADDLEEAERIAREQQELETKCRETETALLESAEGLSVSELERQTATLNPDELPGTIDALNREIEQNLDPEIKRLSETLGEKKRELQQMDGSAKAAEAALSAEQTLATIRRMSEQFIRLKVASSVLKQEIEQFRSKNQDPLLKIASRYFRQLTLGSFEALRADEDDRGQPVLAGLQHQSRMIRVEGMSSGTRDQLYLSLRLASLEKRREAGETMPFIADDILVNFDDERARATLEALATLAAKTQIVLFTHHQRIADEVRKMAGKTNMEVLHI